MNEELLKYELSKKKADFITFLLVILVVIFSMSGCITDAKLKQHAFLYYDKHPEDLAKACADKYPPIVKAGKVITKKDTSYLPGEKIPCPEWRQDSTTHKPVRDSVKCPDLKFVHDSTFVHDTIIPTARVDELQLKLEGKSNQLTVCAAQCDGFEKTAKKYTLLTIVFAVLFGVCLVGWVRK